MTTVKPRIKINWEDVEKYLIAGCTGTQVAAKLGFHKDTLYDRCVKENNMSFSDYSAKKRQKGNSLLHAKQFQVAMGGNTALLVWLGKQRLGQEESPKNAEGFDGTLAELLDAIKGLKKEKGDEEKEK